MGFFYHLYGPKRNGQAPFPYESKGQKHKGAMGPTGIRAGVNELSYPTQRRKTVKAGPLDAATKEKKNVSFQDESGFPVERDLDESLDIAPRYFGTDKFGAVNTQNVKNVRRTHLMDNNGGWGQDQSQMMSPGKLPQDPMNSSPGTESVPWWTAAGDQKSTRHLPEGYDQPMRYDPNDLPCTCNFTVIPAVDYSSVPTSSWHGNQTMPANIADAKGVYGFDNRPPRSGDFVPAMRVKRPKRGERSVWPLAALLILIYAVFTVGSAF